MKIINLSSIANPISISVQNPSRSDYDRFIGLEHYDSGEPVITRFQGTELLTTSAKAFKANDILIARRNVYLKRAGIVFFDGITSGDSIILRLKEDIQKTIGYSREDLIRYIPFMLNSEHFWIYANKHADGMNSKRISKDTLLEYEFELPSIDEMRDISDKLWAAYRLKEAYKKLLVTTDEMVKSQFIEMFDFNDLSLTSPANDFSKYCKDDTSSATKIVAGDYLSKGIYPIYDQSKDNTIAGYTNKKEGLCDNVPAVLFGDHSRVIKYINTPFFIGADGVKIIRPKINEIIPEFLYYDLKYHTIPNTGYNRHFKFVKMLKLTKASMEKQNEFLLIARQADKSKFELKQCIEHIDKVIKSLING